jgi:probable F420-dependent oxidoreductase
MMQFAVHLPTYWDDYGQSSVGVAVEAAAKAAEALGYRGLWANDHIIAPASQSYVRHFVEPLITLASLIHLVPGLELGTSVLVLPQRHAILVAKQVATLDILSNGRFIFGLGVGWLEEEFRFLNADFDRRSEVADEAIRAIRTLWRDDPASFEGEHYHFADATFLPKPANGGPPLWIGGGSSAAVRRAARFGDGWVPFWMSFDSFEAGLDHFRTKLTALNHLVGGRPRPTIAGHLKMRIATGDRGGHAPDQVAGLLHRYQEAGLEYVICDFTADDVDHLMRQMEITAQLIAPRFAD